MAIYDPQTIRLFAKNDVLLDLRPFVERYQLPVDKLYPGLRPYIYYGDKIVGVPENCGPYVLFYNRKLFREAGIPYPKPGWTWDECLDVAKKLTKYRDGERAEAPDAEGPLRRQLRLVVLHLDARRASLQPGRQGAA